MIRGAIVSEYPYPILEAHKLGYGQVAINIVAVLAGVTVLAPSSSPLTAPHPRGHAGTVTAGAQRPRRAAAALFGRAADRLFPRRPLPCGAGRFGAAPGVHRGDRGVPRLQQIAWATTSQHAAAGIRLSRPQPGRPLVPARAALGRGPAARHGAARGAARPMRARCSYTDLPTLKACALDLS